MDGIERLGHDPPGGPSADCNMRFTDDIILFSDTAPQLQGMINELNDVSITIGLGLNASKTKVMTNSHTIPIKVNSNALEYVQSYIYLGQQVSFSKTRHEDEGTVPLVTLSTSSFALYSVSKKQGKRMLRHDWMKIIRFDDCDQINSDLSAQKVSQLIAMSSSVCYKCNRTGHFARECTQGGVAPRDSGFNRQREKCFKCNRTGHFARDCKEEADRCYRCNGTGHIARECAQSPDEPSCYNCNKTGHIARNCPEGGRDSSGQTCYNCNKAGHISRNCPDGTKTCYVCGKPGHISRDCDESERN
ncbi:unnamed protein product [Chilo suppressalis]|uniref:CCHC-type domain-containing protein n=1 Tax=Chilo suppressalis TaxID=168631 RepID=A0ABN8AYK0_CHISP|nr:unnamed protein product [Chilo suppressalis]